MVIKYCVEGMQNGLVQGFLVLFNKFIKLLIGYLSFFWKFAILILRVLKN